MPADAIKACDVLRASIAELCISDHNQDPYVLARWGSPARRPKMSPHGPTTSAVRCWSQSRAMQFWPSAG
jgi:hypothetical protein